MEWSELGDWLRDHAGTAWVGLAFVLGALELLSLDLIFAMLAGGALVAAITAVLGGGAVLQVVLAVVSALAMLTLIRPSVVRRLHHGPDLKIGAEALIGSPATVLRELAHGQPGRVKIGGEEWTALPYDEDDRIEPGALVDVVQIKGATALVLRRHRLEP